MALLMRAFSFHELVDQPDNDLVGMIEEVDRETSLFGFEMLQFLLNRRFPFLVAIKIFFSVPSLGM